MCSAIKKALRWRLSCYSNNHKKTAPATAGMTKGLKSISVESNALLLHVHVSSSTECVPMTFENAKHRKQTFTCSHHTSVNLFERYLSNDVVGQQQ